MSEANRDDVRISLGVAPIARVLESLIEAMNSDIDALKSQTWHGARWEPMDKPIVVIDGSWRRIKDLNSPIEGSHAYVVGVNQASFEKLCQFVRVESLHFYEMRVADLQPLALQRGLSRLAIRWDTKLTDISALAGLESLKTLVFEDTPKVHDLSPLAGLRQLTALEFSGGVWNANRVESLDPLSRLTQLEELALWNLRVERGGLRPIASCRSLKKLAVSNQFPTEDYAYLAAHLQGTECKMLSPWSAIPQPINGKDAMVTGKGKPLLNSETDRESLDKYSKQFFALRDKYKRD